MSDEPRPVVQCFATEVGAALKKAQADGITPSEAAGVCLGAGATLAIVAGASPEEVQNIVNAMYEREQSNAADH